MSAPQTPKKRMGHVFMPSTFTENYRSDLNPARIPPTNSSGCSPGCEVCTFGELVVMDELHIRFLCPTLGRLVDLFGESAHGDGKFHTSHIEEAAGHAVLL